MYLLILPAVIYLLVFCYQPMYGVLIAFKDFKPSLGVWGSPWVGLKHFIKFFNSESFMRTLSNTLLVSIYSLLAGFPIPILLALAMNAVNVKWFKKIVQTVTYAPHFISVVVIVGMIDLLFSPGASGLVNNFLGLFGVEPIFFLGKSEYFRHLYVWSGVWQGMGWGSIIYLAALAGVDPSLHEAAEIDGASRLQRMWHIDLPCILPTVVIMLILNAGKVMNVGFEKVFLMQNPLNIEAAEVISTYVYQRGLLNAQYSFSTAVGLFNSVVNIILLLIVNKISQTVGETSLW
ncbi:MAG: ABC transporter permease subunit [Angelakisella sp.]